MKHCLIVVALVSVTGHVYAQGAVSPDRVAQIAKTVHDAEGWNLGASSTRDTRNEFWARVIGIVHWGHPVYNTTPDPSWCLKDGGRGRPQTDDVATQCVSRLFWDCIGGVGSNGYENNFRCAGHGAERLPEVQNVYAPPKPAGGGASSGGSGNPGSAPPSPAPGPAVDLSPVLNALKALEARLAALEAKGGAVDAAASEALNAASRASEIKTLIQNLPASQPIPCLVGRVPKTFGGSSEVTFCPKVP
jgi:hypothetical protein